jgi:tetratricopeptide (TPR) repeat protein
MAQDVRFQLLTVVLCLVCLPFKVVAQGATWEQTMKAARSAELQRRPAEAEKLYVAAVNKAEAFGQSDSRLAIGLESLGMFYYGQNRHAEAEAMLKRALAIGTKSGASEIRRIRANLAGVLQAEGKDREAEKLYIDGVKEAKKSGQETIRYADSLEYLAGFYEGRREFEQAVPLFKEALNIKKHDLSPNDLDLTEPLGQLAMLYESAGKFSQAEPYTLQKIHIEEKAFGSESANCAQELGFLAELYRKEGKFIEAEETLKRALNIYTKLDGPDSLAVAGSLGGLAHLAKQEKNYALAELFYKQALAIERKAQGPDGIGVLSTLQELAEVFRLEEDYAKAEGVYEGVLTTEMKQMPPGSGLTLGTIERLGSLYAQEGKFPEAEALYRKAVESDLVSLPHGHLTTIASLNDLALFLERRNRLAEAETYYKKAFDQFGGVQPSGNSLMDHNLSIVMKNYARLMRKMNRPVEAAAYEKRVKEIDKRLAPKPLKK